MENLDNAFQKKHDWQTVLYNESTALCDLLDAKSTDATRIDELKEKIRALSHSARENVLKMYSGRSYEITHFDKELRALLESVEIDHSSIFLVQPTNLNASFTSDAAASYDR